MSDTPATPTAAKPKRWPVALLIGFITGISGAVLAVPVSDWAMEAHHVSTREGGRACAAIGIYAPLGMIVGCLVGFSVSFLFKRRGFAGYAMRQGLALAIIAAIVCAVGGLAYSAADHPPLIDGRTLALEIEVRAPTKNRSIEELKAADFKVALVVSASDRSYSDLRWSDAVRTDEYITVPAWADLNSQNAGREITVHTGAESGQLFNVLLPARPKKIEETWSDWMKPRERFDRSKPSLEDQCLARYRVRFAEQYSPTPSPTSAPSKDESPAPPPQDSASDEAATVTAEPAATP